MVVALDRLSWRQKQYIFTATAVLTGLYLLDITNELVGWIFEYKLDFFPILSVKNVIGILSLWLAIAIIYQQVA